MSQLCYDSCILTFCTQVKALYGLAFKQKSTGLNIQLSQSSLNLVSLCLVMSESNICSTCLPQAHKYATNRKWSSVHQEICCRVIIVVRRCCFYPAASLCYETKSQVMFLSQCITLKCSHNHQKHCGCCFLICQWCL